MKRTEGTTKYAPLLIAAVLALIAQFLVFFGLMTLSGNAGGRATPTMAYGGLACGIAVATLSIRLPILNLRPHWRRVVIYFTTMAIISIGGWIFVIFHSSPNLP